MLGSSRVSIATLLDSLVARFEQGLSEHFDAAGKSLLQVVDVLADERALRMNLADPSISSQAKAATVSQLFGSQISPLALEVLIEVVSARWSSDSDMVDAVEQAGYVQILMAAEKTGHIDRVEEELFRFGRAIDANPSLQMALTDPATSPAVKAGIVHSLLDGRATLETVLLVSHGAGSLRGRRIQDVIVSISELAAGRRGRIIADVRVAGPLSPTQEQRLAASLSALHGRLVELNVLIDPDVVGGIEVRVGDDVIDGTISSKLEQARRKLAG